MNLQFCVWVYKCIFYLLKDLIQLKELLAKVPKIYSFLKWICSKISMSENDYMISLGRDLKILSKGSKKLKEGNVSYALLCNVISFSIVVKFSAVKL